LKTTKDNKDNLGSLAQWLNCFEQLRSQFSDSKMKILLKTQEEVKSVISIGGSPTQPETQWWIGLDSLFLYFWRNY